MHCGYNSVVPANERTNLVFSARWLYRFRKRQNFKCCHSHGESGYADVNAAQALPHLRQLASEFYYNDIYNADEFAFWYIAAPTTTI